ncbi:MAG TPA: AMP-binding protein, partial [Pseudomonadales bacterium]|nr:AMP-binding protein [Pseudomonadales bacterium]
MAALSLSRILAHWAAQQPDRVAVSHEGRDVTFAQLEASSNRLARAYEKRGVSADDFVTIALPNSIAFFDACFATWKLGATPQPVSAKLPKFELDQIIEVGNPKLVVGADPSAHPGVTTLPVGYEADRTLSSEPLPERTAISWKAMTSGGSTGRPKLIVTKQPATRDPE